MATYYRINLRDKQNNIVYPNIHNLINIKDNGDLELNNIYPRANNTYSLGSSAKYFNSITSLKYTIPTKGISWNQMALNVVGINGNTPDSNAPFYPSFTFKDYVGDIISFGIQNVNVGFWCRYLDTPTTTNGTNWSSSINAQTGLFTHSKAATFKGLLTGEANISSKNAQGGDTYFLLDRGTAAANWKILDSSGTLKFQTDYTSGKVATYYDCMTLAHNTGNLWLKGQANIQNGAYIVGTTKLNTNQYNGLQITRQDTNGSSIAFNNSAGNLGKIGFSYEKDLIIGNTSDGAANLLKITSTGVTTFYNTVTASRFIGTADKTNLIYIQDTRSVNGSPSTYKRGMTFEFKARTTLGFVGNQTYGAVATVKQWDDKSGGAAYQLAFCASGTSLAPYLSIRSSVCDATSWSGAWFGVVLSANRSIVNLYGMTIANWNANYSNYMNGTVAFCW